jgi:hypothetical protein
LGWSEPASTILTGDAAPDSPCGIVPVFNFANSTCGWALYFSRGVLSALPDEELSCVLSHELEEVARFRAMYKAGRSHSVEEDACWHEAEGRRLGEAWYRARQVATTAVSSAPRILKVLLRAWVNYATLSGDGAETSWLSPVPKDWDWAFTAQQGWDVWERAESIYAGHPPADLFRFAARQNMAIKKFAASKQDY